MFLYNNFVFLKNDKRYLWLEYKLIRLYFEQEGTNDKY